MTVTVHEVDIESTVEGTSPGLRAVVGTPHGPGPWPAVVVLHEAFGAGDEMRKQVAHLASLGYLAVMPDLFSAGGFRRCITATMRSLTSGTGTAYSDIEAARIFARDNPDSTGVVGVLGFCMGGGFALMTADTGFSAAAVNYGTMPRDLSAQVANACPIVASYGGNDVTLKGAAAKLESALTSAGVTHDVKEYPGAGHVFMNELPDGPLLLRPLVRVLGFGPRPEAAADAWRRIDAFFGEHLASSAR